MLTRAAALVLLLITPAHAQSQAPIPVPAPAPRDSLIPVQTPYLDIVRKYLDGDDAGAIADLTLLPINGLEDRIFDDLERATVRVVGKDDPRELEPGIRAALARTWTTLAHGAAILHLDTARYLLQRDDSRVDEGIKHVFLARQLMDWSVWAFVHQTLRSTKDAEAHRRIKRGVYLAIAALLQNQVRLGPLKDHLKSARSAFPGDAEVLLASGAAEELAADVPIVRQMQPPSGTRLVESWRRVVRNTGLNNAEDFLRQATERDPNLAEAFLHLGRVQHQRGKRAEARKSLEAARDLHPISEIGYLTALFLARLTEDEGGDESAFAQYRAIVKTWPDCHTGHVALSRMFEARGDRQAALGALAPLWRDLRDRACPIDPWWAYIYGQAWRLPLLLESLRTEVRSWS